VTERPATRDDAAGPILPAPVRDAWLGVELRHMQALAAVAREGSFREAAESLGYVQSAISQQIAQLERLVGARLIDRARGVGTVQLTDAGELLLEHVREILARYERAEGELASLSAGHSGTLRVGMPQSVAARVLPQVLAAFAEQRPDVQVLPSESPVGELLLEEVAAGALDLAFCELPLPEGPFAAEELMEDPLLLMVAAGSVLARRGEPVTAADLDGLATIAYRRWTGQRRVLDDLARDGAVPEIVFTSEHNQTVQSLVASGMGAAIAPYLAVDAAHPGTTLLPIAVAPARTIALAWHQDRELPPAAATFRDVARGVCRELAAGIAPGLRSA